MKVIFIRHGETNKNIGNKLHEASDQESLNQLGKEQIEKTAKALSSYSISKMYHSKELRAVESANIIANFLNISALGIDGLQERNWGIYSNKPWSEVGEILKDMTLDERYNYIPENGESWKVFEERLIRTIKEILNHSELDKDIVIVTHGGAIRALMPYLLNVPKEESFKYDPDNASLTIFDYKEGKFIEEKINNTEHLI